MRTLTDEQVEKRAGEALEILNSVNDDSFAATNAVRALSDYNELTPEDRQAINLCLNDIISS